MLWQKRQYIMPWDEYALSIWDVAFNTETIVFVIRVSKMIYKFGV